MSLFEKLNNKRYNLHEAIDEKGNITPEPGDKAIEKSILRNIKKKQVQISKSEKQNISQNKVAGQKLLQDINRKLSASTTKGDQARALYGTEGGSTEGTAGAGGTATKTKSKAVKQSEVSKKAKEFTKQINKKRTGGFDNVTGEGQVKYPKTRDQLIAKRKEYGIDRKGNISDAGVKRYAQKTKQLSSGSNLPVTPTQKELDIAKKRAVGGTPIKNKAGKVIGTTTGKYGGKLSRKRPSNAPSLAQIKAKIDAKNPTYKSPLTGGKLPNIGTPESQIRRNDPKGYKELMKMKKKLKGVKSPYYQGTVLPDGTIKPKVNFKDMPKTILKKQKYFKGQEIPGFRKVSTATKAGKKFYQQQIETGRRITSKQLTGEPPKPLTRLQKIKKAVTTGWKIPKDTGNFIEKTRGTGKNITKTFTRKYYKPNLLGTVAKNLDKVPNRYKALAAAGLITYGLLGRNKTEKADASTGAGAGTSKPKVMKYTTGTTKLRLGGTNNKSKSLDF